MIRWTLRICDVEDRFIRNLLGKLREITDKPFEEIIDGQLDIKLGQFTEKELDAVLKKIKRRKAAGLDDIPPEVWKTRKLDVILLRLCYALYRQNTIEKCWKGCIFAFLKKGITKTLNTIAP